MGTESFNVPLWFPEHCFRNDFSFSRPFCFTQPNQQKGNSKSLTLTIFSFLLLLLSISSTYSQPVKSNGFVYADSSILKISKQTLLSKSLSPAGAAELLPKIKEDFIVNTFDTLPGAKKTPSCIAGDSSGNYAVVWIDGRNGANDVYICFFNNQNAAITGNIKVNEYPATFNTSPSIASNQKGDYVVSWILYPNSIMAQLFDKAGNKKGSNFEANINQRDFFVSTSASINEDGSFTIMYESETDISQTKIYSQSFSADANPAGTGFLVAPVFSEGISSIGFNFFSASDENGNIAVTWSEYYKGFSRIFARIKNFNSPYFGSTILISDTSGNYYDWIPKIVASKDGHFLIDWDMDDNYNFGSMHGVQILKADGTKLNNKIVYSEIANVYSTAGNNSFGLVYLKDKYLFQKINADGKTDGEPIPFRYYSEGSIFLNLAGASPLCNNKFSLLWGSLTSENTNEIYIQSINTPTGESAPLIKVNDDLLSSWEVSPVIHVNKDGSYIIAWDKQLQGKTEIYARLFDKYNNPAGTSVKVTDFKSSDNNNKKIIALSDGSFVIAFIKVQDNNVSSLLFQRISASGIRIGNNFTAIAEDGYYYNAPRIAINRDDKDRILAATYSYDNGYYSVKFRLFDKDFSVLAYSDNLFTKVFPGSDTNPFALSVNSNLKIFISWADSGKGNMTDIKNKIFDEYGKVFSDEFILKSYPYSSNIYTLENCLDINNKDLVVFLNSSMYQFNYIRKYGSSLYENFCSYREYYYDSPENVILKNKNLFFTLNTNSRVKGYYINDNRQAVNEFLLSDYGNLPVYEFKYNDKYNCALFGDKLYFVFESNKNGNTGYDIWANIQKCDFADFKKDFLRPLVNNDMLLNIYPNPFNAATKIPFYIYAYHKVKLAVYDILGREVKVLVNNNLERGYYEVDLNASQFASGVYFCRLEAFNTSVKSIVIVK